MTYTLMMLLLASGEFYVERTNLSLHECAGYAAMLRIETRDLEKRIGEIRYYCTPEKQ